MNEMESGSPEMNALFEFFLEHLSQGVLGLDVKGKVVWINKSYQNWSGLTLAQARDTSIFELSPTLNYVRWKKGWKQLVENGYVELDSLHLHHTGDLFPVRLQVHYFQYGNHSYACCIIDDKLKSDSERDLLATVTAALKMSAWEWDDLRKEFTAHPDFYNLLQLSETTEITEENWKEILRSVLTETQAAALTSSIQQSLQDGSAFESQVQTPQNGRWLKIMANAILTEEKVVKLYGFIQDVQQEQENIADLRAAKFTLDQAQEAIVWLDVAGNVIYANAAVSRLLDYSASELAAMKVVDFARQFEENTWEQHWKNLQQKQNISEETVYRHKSGRDIIVEVYINYYEFDDQQFSCMFIRDISSKKQKDGELQVAYEEIRSMKEQFERENTYLKEEIRQEHNFDEIVSRNIWYQQMLAEVGQVAVTNATVLILGETGTGKELLARAVHRLSRRVKRPLIKVNCAALPPNIIESELFGHEKGAFTGAVRRKIGRFELANGGTIFLDEIGELSLDTQVKLLRVLQEGEFERVGSSETIKTDIRIIAATNRNLPLLISEGKFRQDLYYRLNVFPINNIPLRERKDDIPILVEYFKRKYSDKSGKKIIGVASSFMEKLMQYDFPGNIRELENLIERAVILSDFGQLDLPQWTDHLQDPTKVLKGFETFEQMQRSHILEALKRANWRVSGEFGAADLLDLNPKTLESKMRKLKIHRQDYQT